jgi:hypothetical protein
LGRERATPKRVKRCSRGRGLLAAANSVKRVLLSAYTSFRRRGIEAGYKYQAAKRRFGANPKSSKAVALWNRRLVVGMIFRAKPD